MTHQVSPQPAILKGWVDGVYSYSFAYGVGEHSDKQWGDRYGEGTLAGNRAMLIVTAKEHHSARGVRPDRHRRAQLLNRMKPSASARICVECELAH